MADRSPQRSWTFILFFGLFLNSGPAALAIKPAALEARTFGYQLQQEFVTSKSKALTNHFDPEAMWRRVFAPFGIATMEDPETPKIFKAQFLPSLVSDLTVFDSYQTLFLSRVLLIEDARYLEFVLVDESGRFQILLARLHQQTDGAIGISDLWMHGAHLEVSRNLRDTLIVSGVPATGVLDDEEMTLALQMPAIRPAFNQLFYEIGQGQLEAAFTQWLRVPEDVKKTRFWRYLRMRLVFMGSVSALGNLQHAIKEGSEANALVQLSYAEESHTPEGRLRLLDRALRSRQEMPFLQVTKAGVLLEMGRNREALNLARDVYELNPFSISAYLIAVQAAHLLGDEKAVKAALQQWVVLSPASEIDKLIRTTPDLEGCLTSAAYVAWKEKQPSAKEPQVP